MICRDPVTTVDQLEGLRVRASGAPLNIMQLAEASTVQVSLVDTVSLLQRGRRRLHVSAPIVGFMINRDVWNGFTDEQKMAHLRAAPHLSAAHTINNFIIRTNEVLQDQIENNGVQMVEPENPGEWQALMDRFLAEQRQIAIDFASGFGVDDPAAILDVYDAGLEKWRGLAAEIGTDVEAFEQALWNELHSKVDFGSFSMLQRIDRLLELWSPALLALAIVAGFAMMVHVSIDVFMRRALNSPLRQTNQTVAAYFMIAATFLPMALLGKREFSARANRAALTPARGRVTCRFSKGRTEAP